MKSAVAAFAAALIFANCAPPQAVPDAGPQQDAGNPPPDAGPPEPDAGTPDAGTPDAGPPDAGTPDAGTPGWAKLFDTPPSRSTHRTFWWAPTKDLRVLSGNHGNGPIQDFWRFDGTQWREVPMPESDCPERKNSSATLDPVHQRFYVFGGTWSGYPKDGGSYTVRVLGDFRSFDGTQWRDEYAFQDAGAHPSARGGAALGYHSESQQLVLFGGTDNNTPSGETWLNAGAGWNLLVPDGGPSPSPRFNCHLVYDDARKKLVLFGGQTSNALGAVNHDDTWEFDGTGWRDVSGAGARPPGRGHSAMGYDPVRQKVLLFGGARHFAPLPPGSSLDDFWEFDGTQWTPVTITGPKPSARTASTLTFDPERQRLVLYGGFDGDFDLNEVWELPAGATTWQNRTQLPLPRTGFALGQRSEGEALMFGGYMTAGGFNLGDTWRWTAANGWKRLSGAGPSYRSDAALAFHGAIALLVGGQVSSTNYPADAFAMGPGADDWTAIPGPTPRSQAAIAHDPKRGITVVFGGRNAGGRLDDTWVFDGTAWSAKPTATKPPARKDATLLYDPVRERLVLLGGSKTGGVIANDAWTFDGTDWQELTGQTAAPTPRVYQALSIDAKGRLWSVGGYDGTKTYDDAAVYENGAWRPVTPTGPAPRFSAKLLRTGPERFTLVGGASSDFFRIWVDFGDAWELGPR